MKKVYILIIFANICVLVIASILLVSCTTGNNNDSVPDYALSSQIQEKTPEEEAREQKYSEELKKANEEINSYKYLYGDSDYYETTLAMNTAGSKVPVFLNPEKALEQSF